MIQHAISWLTIALQPLQKFAVESKDVLIGGRELQGRLARRGHWVDDQGV